MVSTRSHSVLEAEDTAGTHGEVNSAGPTPRRSGRVRGSGSAATPAVERPPPRTSLRTAGRLRAIEEEQQTQAQQQDQQPEGQQPGGAGEQQQGAAAPSLQAARAVVDLLAEQMFAALNEAFGDQADGGQDSSSDEDEGPANGSQAAAPGQADDNASSGSSDDGSDSGSGSEDEDGVPRHLRWQPELTLPGMREQQEGQHRQQQRGSAAAAAGVHVVRRGAKRADSLHVPPPDERAALRAARKAAPDTAGRGWFDLPATQVTEEVKNDLRMLRLRGALDPKAHYKKLDSTKFPKYFQMGTVVEGPADFYSARLTSKQRKRTLTEEVMADEGLTAVRKKRYNSMQEERGRWSKKKAGRKTDNERRKKAHRRPKH